MTPKGNLMQKVLITGTAGFIETELLSSLCGLERTMESDLNV